MQPQSEPKGLPELRDVVGRLAHRAGLRSMSPGHVKQVADHIYHGKSEGPLAPDSPFLRKEDWVKLARAGDPRAEQPHDHDTIFNIASKRVGNYRNALRGNEIGPGWTNEELQKLGRPRQPHELSPGDQQAHRWLRDREYLEAIANRDRSKDADWSGGWPWQKSQLDDAIHYYNKGHGASYSHGVGEGDVWPTANFKHYTTGREMLRAMQDPDFAIGAIGHAFSPVAHYVNKLTTRDAGAKDPEVISQMRQSSFDPVGVGAAAGAGYDFWRNFGKSLLGDAVREDGHSEILDDMRQSLEHTQDQWAHNVSPRLGIDHGDADERRAAQQQNVSDLASASGMSYDDYYRAKTGTYPSLAGSLLATAMSDAPFDPDTLIMLPFGGAGGFAREAAESLMYGLPLVGGAHASTQELPDMTSMFSPGLENRPDLKADYMPDDQFQSYITNYDEELKNAHQRVMARSLGRALTEPPVQVTGK